MANDKIRPPAEEIVLYEKDVATKIATITLNRPDMLNAPSVAARIRFGELVHRANVDDDVKVLVIRGVGEHFGSGADLPEMSNMFDENSQIRRCTSLGFLMTAASNIRREGRIAIWRVSRSSMPIPISACAVFRISRRSVSLK